jgi:hypothetical protein
MRRAPSLRFERDASISQGRSIERVIEEIHAEDAARPPAPEDEPEPDPAASQ